MRMVSWYDREGTEMPMNIYVRLVCLASVLWLLFELSGLLLGEAVSISC